MGYAGTSASSEWLSGHNSGLPRPFGTNRALPERSRRGAQPLPAARLTVQRRSWKPSEGLEGAKAVAGAAAVADAAFVRARHVLHIAGAAIGDRLVGRRQPHPGRDRACHVSHLHLAAPENFHVCGPVAAGTLLGELVMSAVMPSPTRVQELVAFSLDPRLTGASSARRTIARTAISGEPRLLQCDLTERCRARLAGA